MHFKHKKIRKDHLISDDFKPFLDFYGDSPIDFLFQANDALGWEMSDPLRSLQRCKSILREFFKDLKTSIDLNLFRFITYLEVFISEKMKTKNTSSGRGLAHHTGSWL